MRLTLSSFSAACVAAALHNSRVFEARFASYADFYPGSSSGPTRTDGGGEWDFKPVRRHRKLKGFRRDHARRR